VKKLYSRSAAQKGAQEQGAVAQSSKVWIRNMDDGLWRTDTASLKH
jgi:hypothetical protein